MSERLVLTPPEIVEVERPVIFLAGPIQDARNWQPEAAEIIHDLDSSIIVASPRKTYVDGTFVYNKQVDWETHFLQTAGSIGVVSFWLERQQRTSLPLAQRMQEALRLIFRPESIEIPRSFAQTSRFELGEWKAFYQLTDAQLTIGIDEGFGNARYIRRRFSQDCPDVRITDNLPEMCSNAVELVQKFKSINTD